MQKLLLFTIIILLLVACNDAGKRIPQQSTEVSDHNGLHQGQHLEDKSATQHGHGRHHGGSANAYMHQSSIEELIQRFESPARGEHQRPEKVIEYLGEVEGKKIVDIGAGSGYFSVKLAEQGAQVIAADVNDGFQDFLKSRIQENDIINIELRKVPFDSPDLKDNEVDMALIVNTYH
ncbi:MAG: methyltransferase domain-containing protein, partial [Bacteroidota bacterium]